MKNLNQSFPVRPYLPADVSGLQELFAQSIDELCTEDYSDEQRLAWISRAEDRRAFVNSRLKEIEGGAPEKFFEERRTLTEYQPTPRFLLLWRMVGAAIGITAAVLLIMEVAHQRNEDAARIEATHAMAAARIAVGKAENGDRATYRDAQAELARADTALKKWEELAED